MNAPSESARQVLTAQDLREHGLLLEGSGNIGNSLVYERPTYIYEHFFKDCSLGAFSFCNSAGSSSAYRCRFGRYVQIGESTILGPPEHPQDWFSNHPFAFTQPHYMPRLYQLPEFVRLAPEATSKPSYADTVASETVIGHEVYIGAGAFIKRGLTIGDGAVIGARSVVTRDVPPYAIVAGVPARVVRLRFSDAIVERMLRLQWWRYDLAPYKRDVDFANVEATLDRFENELAAGRLQLLQPPSFRITRVNGGYTLDSLPAALF